MLIMIDTEQLQTVCAYLNDDMRTHTQSQGWWQLDAGKLHTALQQYAPPATIHATALEHPDALKTALSQITENRKVWIRKLLIFQYTIFGFCLEKAILRQSRTKSWRCVAGRSTRRLSKGSI